MKKMFSFLFATLMTLFASPALAVEVTVIEPDEVYSSIDDLLGAGSFAIVNTTDGKALYGKDAQNLGYGTYEDAFKSTNSGYLWKLVEADEEGNYHLQLITPAGADYNCWGMGGMLNSQGEPQGWACSFILGLNNQKGQDIPNGAVYTLTYTNDGWTIKNVGTGMYQPYSTGPANSTEPTYWQFCSLKENTFDDGTDPVTYEIPASLNSLIENGTVFTLKSGDLYLYGTEQQAIGAGDWATACAETNNANGYILEKNDEGIAFFRAVKTDGSNISAWGTNPCYLNSQPSIGGVIFNMGKDQDFKNGSSWTISEVEGGYSIQNLGNGGYLNTNGLSETPVVWEFYVPGSPADAPVVAIEEGEGTYTVTSTSADAALYYLCKPMSWLDDGETPESCLQTDIEDMGSMIDSEDTWEMYGHMGLQPAPKTFTVADYEEMYAGQDMFIVAANVGWNGEKLAVISNVELKNFTVPSPQSTELAEGDYVIKNVKSGLYLNGANAWGTKASATLHGQFMTLAKVEDEKYTIDTHISNGGDKHYLAAGDNTFVDALPANHTIEMVAEGIYTIKDSNDKYLAAGEDGLVNFNADDVTEAAKWQFITKEELIASFEDATADAPVDATALIGDANFSRNNLWISKWDIQPNKGGANENFNAEKWGGNSETFTSAQTLTDLPNGFYTLKFQGYYRYNNTSDNTNDVAVAAHADGTEEIFSYAFANDVEVPLTSIADEANVEANGGVIPFSQADASAAFDKGLYSNEFNFEVTDGTINLGVKKVDHLGTDWTVWDNFELYYLGSEAPLEQTIEATLINGEDEFALTSHNSISVEKANAIKVTFGIPAAVASATYAIMPMNLVETENGSSWVPSYPLSKVGELSMNGIAYAEFDKDYTFKQGTKYQIDINVSYLDQTSETASFFVNGATEVEPIDLGGVVAVNGTELKVTFKEGTDLGDTYANKPYIMLGADKIEIADYSTDCSTGGDFDPLNVVNITLKNELSAGQYTLVIPAGTFIVNGGDENEEISLPFTVENNDPVYVETDLTLDMFKEWDSFEANANVVGPGAGEYHVGESSGLPYGNGSVLGAHYADLSDYKALKLTVTEGTPRILFNRPAMGDSGVADYVEIKSADNQYVSVDGEVWTIDIEAFVADNGYCHVNAIKGANWANATITSMVLLKEAEEVEPTMDVELTNGEEENIALNTHNEVSVETADGIVATFDGIVPFVANYQIFNMALVQDATGAATWEAEGDPIAEGELSISGKAVAEFAEPIVFEQGNKYYLVVKAENPMSKESIEAGYVINGAYAEPYIIAATLNEEIALSTHSEASAEQANALTVEFGTPAKVASASYTLVEMIPEDTEESTFWRPGAAVAEGTLSVSTVGYAELDPAVVLYQGTRYGVILDINYLDGSSYSETYIVNGATVIPDIVATTLNEDIALSTHSEASAEEASSITVEFGNPVAVASATYSIAEMNAIVGAESTSWEAGDVIVNGNLSVNTVGYAEIDPALTLNQGSKYAVTIDVTYFDGTTFTETYVVNGATFIPVPVTETYDGYFSMIADMPTVSTTAKAERPCSISVTTCGEEGAVSYPDIILPEVNISTGEFSIPVTVTTDEDGNTAYIADGIDVELNTVYYSGGPNDAKTYTAWLVGVEGEKAPSIYLHLQNTHQEIFIIFNPSLENAQKINAELTRLNKDDQKNTSKLLKALKDVQAATAINGVATESLKAGKYLENGKVIIVRDGKTFNVNGAVIK